MQEDTLITQFRPKLLTRQLETDNTIFSISISIYFILNFQLFLFACNKSCYLPYSHTLFLKQLNQFQILTVCPFPFVSYLVRPPMLAVTLPNLLFLL